MLRTCEIRWFFQEPPVDLSRLLREEAELQERTDWYLMPTNTECGVKIREGLLETKLRTARYGERTFGPLHGYLESWKKWSLDFGADVPPSLEELAGVGWTDVDKKRYLQRFSVRDRQVTQVTTRPECGCEFEVTELSAYNQTYWTVGFEAVGEIHELESNLRRVVEEILARGGLLQPFMLANSLGYAQWLSTLANP